MKSNIYLLVTIDTECDKGVQWRVKKPMQFQAIEFGVGKILHPLFHRYGIKETYLLSPEVINHKKSVSLFKSLKDSIELGTHLHGEYIAPMAMPETERTDDFQSEYSERIEKGKLINLTLKFKEAFGRAPLSFRAGRFALSSHTLRILQELNYLVDSSVTPFINWSRNKKHKVLYFGAETQPYYPDENDFRRRGTMKLLEIPVTIWHPFFDIFPKKVLRAIPQLNMFWQKLSGKRAGAVWLRPTFSSSREMLDIADRIIHKYRSTEKVIALNMMFHNVEAVTNCSPYNQNESDTKDFLNRVEEFFIEMRNRYKFQSLGLSEICDFYKE